MTPTPSLAKTRPFRERAEKLSSSLTRSEAELDIEPFTERIESALAEAAQQARDEAIEECLKIAQNNGLGDRRICDGIRSLASPGERNEG